MLFSSSMPCHTDVPWMGCRSWEFGGELFIIIAIVGCSPPTRRNALSIIEKLIMYLGNFSTFSPQDVKVWNCCLKSKPLCSRATLHGTRPMENYNSSAQSQKAQFSPKRSCFLPNLSISDFRGGGRDLPQVMFSPVFHPLLVQGGGDLRRGVCVVE